MHISRLAAVATTVLVTTALAGCSGSTVPADDGSDSPLSTYLSSVWGGDLSEEEQLAQFEKQNAEREELIAQCMTEEGFEYIPNTGNSSISFGTDQEWKPDDREWVAQYGYGNVNWPGRDEMNEAPAEEYTDPNQDYVESLSESEMTAYYEALYGPTPSEDELGDDGSYEWNWETAGCSGVAQHEVDGDNPMMSGEHQPIMDAINDFYMTVAESPELAAIDAAWAACMDEADYPGFTKQQDASSSISDEMNAYYENQTEWVEDDPELAKIGEREIDLALADLDCREKTDYRSQSRKVTDALEEQFIADHKTELEALKAAAEQGR